MAFFASPFFEKKCFFARKRSDYLEKKYRHAHGIAKGLDNLELGDQAHHALRHIREALLTPYSPEENTKIIWMYWNTPLADAPEVVRLGYQSWKSFNPGYKVVLLNDQTLEDQLGFNFNTVFDISNIRLTLANRADLLRIYLLSQYGGIWVDATSFCLRPIESWLPSISQKCDFFAFRQQDVRSRPIEVWFMHAIKGSPIIKNTLQLFINYLVCKRNKAVHVSNSKKKMRQLGIEKNHPERLYADTIYAAEKHGFMPYFSLSYFLNESMKELLSNEEIEHFFNLPNFFSNNHDGIETFLGSYVSKQTYKSDYQNSAVYEQRKEALFSILPNIQ